MIHAVSPMISLSYLQKEMGCNVARPGGNVLGQPLDSVPHFFLDPSAVEKWGRPTAAFLLLLESRCCEARVCQMFFFNNTTSLKYFDIDT